MTIDYKKSEILNIESRYQSSNEDIDLLLFVGHAHSGHSIIGSILDCHQQLVLANEVNIIKVFREHQLTANQIEAILMHEANLKKDSKWLNSAYQYDIENSHQGAVTAVPRVIGDKKAGGTTRILHQDPWVLDKLLSIYGQRLKVIFVKRNPYDVVAAYSHYMKQPVSQFHVDRYIENYKTARVVEKIVGEDQFIQINQSEFIHDPVDQVLRIFKFIDLAKQLCLAELETWCAIVKKDIQGKSEQIKIPKGLSAQINKFM